MRRKEFMNVNEERLKEIMAHETDADGCPKTHPDGIEKEEDRGKEGKRERLHALCLVAAEELARRRGCSISWSRCRMWRTCAASIFNRYR